MATGTEWLTKLARLRVDRASGDPAPHKPLLLLTVIELAEENALPVTTLPLSPELAFRFFSYWSIVAHRRRQKPDLRLPFHHLQSDGFWTALTEAGEPSTSSRETRFAKMPPDLIVALGEPAWRDQARRILISSFFDASEQVSLFELIGWSVPSKQEIAHDLEAVARATAEKKGREARFRITVVGAYNFTCALTGYRLTTVTAGSIVDAAHIHQFADSRNNDPQNGLALCKNAHWLFDQGLWTLSDDYRVVVAVGKYAEECPDQKSLNQYHGQTVRLPKNPVFHPNPIFLAWHRRNKLQQL